MDTGVENPTNAGNVDDAVTDEIIRSALQLIADAYGDHNRPLIDIQPVATGYRAFVENDEGSTTVWIDIVLTEKGTLYVADVEGPYQIRHTVASADPAVAIARAVFAARPHVNALKRQHGWIAPQTPVYIAWSLQSPQLLGVGVALSAALRYACPRNDEDTARYVLMPFSDFVTEIAGGDGYELIAAVESVIRYGAAALRVDREVAARLEKAAAAAS
jgi:hypothetical protein